MKRCVLGEGGAPVYCGASNDGEGLATMGDGAGASDERGSTARRLPFDDDEAR